MVALHALSEYCSKTSGGELDLRVTITAGKETRKTLFITNENALVRQEFEVILFRSFCIILQISFVMPDI